MGGKDLMAHPEINYIDRHRKKREEKGAKSGFAKHLAFPAGLVGYSIHDLKHCELSDGGQALPFIVRNVSHSPDQRGEKNMRLWVYIDIPSTPSFVRLYNYEGGKHSSPFRSIRRIRDIAFSRTCPPTRYVVQFDSEAGKLQRERAWLGIHAIEFDTVIMDVKRLYRYGRLLYKRKESLNFLGSMGISVVIYIVFISPGGVEGSRACGEHHSPLDAANGTSSPGGSNLGR